MKKQLSVKERLIVLSLLPKEGSLQNMRLLRECKEELSFSKEEHEKLQFKQLPDGSVQWNEAGEVSKEVEFCTPIEDIMVDVVTKLDEAGKITEELLPICELFVYGR